MNTRRAGSGRHRPSSRSAGSSSSSSATPYRSTLGSGATGPALKPEQVSHLNQGSGRAGIHATLGLRRSDRLRPGAAGVARYSARRVPQHREEAKCLLYCARVKCRCKRSDLPVSKAQKGSAEANRPSLGALTREIRTPDVVVIGAGIGGLACAVELAERGVDVALIEKDDIGFEQSGRSTAAVTLPGDRDAEDAPLTLHQLAAREWDGFEERWGANVEFNREGWISAAIDEADEASWENERSRWAGDRRVELLEPAAARDRYPSLAGSFRGLEVRRGGHVNPLLAIRALREAGKRSGMRCHIGVTATGFKLAGGRVTAIETSSGHVPCGAVVLAGGIWTPRLASQLGLRLPFQRVRIPVGVTGPLPAGAVPGYLRTGTFGARQNADGTVRVTGGYRITGVIHDLSLEDFRALDTWGPAFLRHRRELSLGLDPRLVGQELAAVARRKPGGVFLKGFEPRVTKSSLRHRLQLIGRLIPSLAEARIHRWFAGVVDITPDFQPTLGAMPRLQNAYVSSGFSGHGFILAPAAGRALADVISHGTTELCDCSPFSPDRFATGRISVPRDALF